MSEPDAQDEVVFYQITRIKSALCSLRSYEDEQNIKLPSYYYDFIRKVQTLINDYEEAQNE